MDVDAYCCALMTHFPMTIETTMFHHDCITEEEIETKATEVIINAFKDKLQQEGSNIGLLQHVRGQPIQPLPILQGIIRSIMINAIDKKWLEHLHEIDYLRTEVSMSAVAQKDPFMEFKHKAFALFEAFSHSLHKEISHLLFSFNLVTKDAPDIKKAISQLQILGPPKELKENLKIFTKALNS